MTATIAKAELKDISSIFNLISEYAQKGLILMRSQEDIKESIHQFFIAKNENEVIGVVSYYDYGETLKEIRSLSVDQKYNKSGIGSGLVKFIVKELNPDNHLRIFVLTYSPDFFRKNGFIPIPKDYLPEKIWKDCSTCDSRNECGETALIYTGI